MANIFRIENGVLYLTLVGPTDDSSWQAPGGKTVDTVTGADYATADGIDFSCQVTSGALNASPNTTQQTTPATFCSPEVVRTSVGVTSYTLDVTGLQDANANPANSISRYLFEHDTKSAYFLLGFDGVNPPKAIGKVTLVAGALGGDARVDLTFTISLPVEVKPDVMFGNSTVSEVVPGGGVVTATSLSGTLAGGSATPASANAPTTLTALQAASPAITASPATAWATDVYAQLPTTGTAVGGQVHWTGSAWAAGKAT